MRHIAKKAALAATTTLSSYCRGPSVQWFGNASWQPANGINKWNVMTWPNHPGGVSASWIKIL